MHVLLNLHVFQIYQKSHILLVGTVGWDQRVTKRCRLPLLTNSALVYVSKCGVIGGVAGSQPMSTAVNITWYGAQINFGDLPPYLTYGWDWRTSSAYLHGCYCLLRHGRSTAIIWNLRRADLGGFLMFFAFRKRGADNMRDMLKADYIPMGFDLRSS